MNLIDTHCHIYYDDYKENFDSLLERAEKNSISHIICVGVDLESSIKCIELSEKHEMIYATVGYHPHESKEASDFYLHELEQLLKHKKVVAIGEMGLDFHYNHSDKNIQKKIFKEQLELAKTHNMPTIVHNRNADIDILECIRETKSERGVIHCFASDSNFAKEIFKQGYIISFTGLITFANEFIDIVKNAPIDKIMLETDSPYLTPVPYRGKKNEPSMIKHIAQKVADIKEVSLELIAKQTTKNAMDFFNLK